MTCGMWRGKGFQYRCSVVFAGSEEMEWDDMVRQVYSQFASHKMKKVVVGGILSTSSRGHVIVYGEESVEEVARKCRLDNGRGSVVGATKVNEERREGLDVKGDIVEFVEGGFPVVLTGRGKPSFKEEEKVITQKVGDVVWYRVFAR